jgi:hypothetical protein
VSRRRIRTGAYTGEGIALTSVIVGWAAAGLGLLIGVGLVVLIATTGDSTTI